MRAPGGGWKAVRAVLLACLAGSAGPAPAGAADVRAVLGMVYDSNLFEAPVDPQSGWVSRFYIASSGYLLKRPGGHVRVAHQGGIKRLWKAERSASGAGEVVANHLEVAGFSHLFGRLALGAGGEVKVKQVNRVPGEEGYLRGMLEGQAQGALGAGFSGLLRYRLGGDDSRDALLPEVLLNEFAVEGGFSRSRKFRGRVGVAWRWLDYERPALGQAPGGGIFPQAAEQSDLLREVSVSVQVYRGMLAHLTYGFLDNASNSFGYGFRAHRVQALLVRHLGYGVDGQAFLTLQFRRYDDPLPPLPGGGSEADEYGQTLLTLKLSRQVTDRFGVSAQYGFFRNGARRSGGFYRKHVYTVSVETEL